MAYLFLAQPLSPAARTTIEKQWDARQRVLADRRAQQRRVIDEQYERELADLKAEMLRRLRGWS